MHHPDASSLGSCVLTLEPNVGYRSSTWIEVRTGTFNRRQHRLRVSGVPLISTPTGARALRTASAIATGRIPLRLRPCPHTVFGRRSPWYAGGRSLSQFIDASLLDPKTFS
jgi:hypothetical protein